MPRCHALLLLTAGLTLAACTSVSTGRPGSTGPVSSEAPPRARLSADASAYVDSVVAVMRRDAVHRGELDFDAIADTIRTYAGAAQTIADTYPAITHALPLLRDHHSSFWTVDEVKQNFGFSDDDIETIKAGVAPQLDPSKLDSLATSLGYASGRVIDGHGDMRVGYLVVPEFDNLFQEGMTLFADSLQSLIRSLDQQGVDGWVVDLRENDGGAAMPMIDGLGPLLDDDNAYYTVDAGGAELGRSYYRDGGYYSLTPGEPEAAPVVQSSVAYRLSNPGQPVAVLTAWKTASSAEAVTAVFIGQPNVAVIGQTTNGLTSVNAFNFLSDNSVLNLTSGYLANRARTMYRQGIAPDIEVPTDAPAGESTGASGDAVLGLALAWIDGEVSR